MSLYSEMMGSFVRTGNYPLEANYIFESEQELKQFYTDNINNTLLHEGLLKIVVLPDKQTLYWVIRDNNKLVLSPLISSNSIDNLLVQMREYKTELEDNVSSLLELITKIVGTENYDDFEDKLDNLLDISNTLVELQKLISLNKDNIKLLAGVDNIENLKNLPYSNLKEVIISLSNFLGNSDTSLKDLLDTLLDISRKHNSDCANLWVELNQTQSGVGLDSSGQYSPDSETNYLKTATSVMNALRILDSKIAALNSSDSANIIDLLGKPNGITPLDGNGFISSQYLPSYVDDVLEFENFNSLPEEGESGKIYVTLDNNLTYRWSGTAYVEVSKSLALGETEGTAFEGKKGKELNDYVNIEKHHGVIVYGEGLGYEFGYFQNSNGALVNTIPILNADGTINHKDKTLPVATQEKNGIMSAKDKLKLNSLYNIESINVSGANSAESQQYTINLNKSTGGSVSKNFTIPSATSTEAGVMSAEDKNKLDNVSGSIIYNAVNVDNENGTSVTRHFNFNHVNGNIQLAVPTINTDTGVATIYSLPIPTATSEHNGVMSKEDKQKLDSILSVNDNLSVKDLSFSNADDGSMLITLHRDNELYNTIIDVPIATDTTNGIMTSSDKEKILNIITSGTAIGNIILLQNANNDSVVTLSLDLYSKSEIDLKFADSISGGTVDLSNYYTKLEVNQLTDWEEYE